MIVILEQLRQIPDRNPVHCIEIVTVRAAGPQANTATRTTGILTTEALVDLALSAFAPSSTMAFNRAKVGFKFHSVGF